jgi:hypothetical protein
MLCFKSLVALFFNTFLWPPIRVLRVKPSTRSRKVSFSITYPTGLVGYSRFPVQHATYGRDVFEHSQFDKPAKKSAF